MRWVIPSYNRPSCTTPLWCKAQGVDWVVVVHNMEQGKQYAAQGVDRLVVADVPLGISPMRRWIWTQWAQPGEWFVEADDILSFDEAKTIVDYEPEVPTEAPLDGAGLLAAINATRDEAERRGAHIAGLATVSTPFYRRKPWADVGYVCGKLRISHAVPELTWDLKVQAMSDFGLLGEALLRHGRVLINHGVWLPKPHYAPGGIGPKKERAAPRARDIPYLLNKYPGLYREYLKDGGKLRDLRLRIHGLSQVRSWQEEMTSGQGVLL